MMATSWRAVVIGAAMVAVLTMAPWATKRVQACGGIGFFSINCDGIIIANQIVQIGHLVSQIREMASQLRSMDGVLNMTTQLASNSPAAGNLGRVRDMMDRQWAMAKDGTGLATDPSGIGAYLQRIPGVTDVGAWLNELAPASTALLGERPATNTSAALAGAFASWALPNEGANLDVLASLADMGDGTRSYRGVWEDMVTAGEVAPLLTATEFNSMTGDAALVSRLMAEEAGRDALGSATLVHAHAEADAASFLVQQVGASSASNSRICGWMTCRVSNGFRKRRWRRSRPMRRSRSRKGNYERTKRRSGHAKRMRKNGHAGPRGRRGRPV